MLPFQFAHPIYLIGFLLLPCIYLLTHKVRASRQVIHRSTHVGLRRLFLRVLTVSLLILSASGLQLRGQDRDATVVFVLDHSESIAHHDRAAGLAYINRAAKMMHQHDKAAVLVFGREVVVERSLGEFVSFAGVRSNPSGTHTNIAQALRLATTILQPYPQKNRPHFRRERECRGCAPGSGHCCGTRDYHRSVTTW